MAFVGDPAWHGLGTEVPPGIGTDGMIVAAGLDWEVWLQPAPGAECDESTGKHDRNLVMRKPLGSETEDVALGWVGQKYEALQNREAFRFFEPFLERGWARFETAGALGRGEVVWVLARLSDEIMIGHGDEIRRYLLLSNSHDGSSAVTVRFTCVRVVCQNTLILSHGKSSSTAAASIHHTRNLQENLRLEQAAKLMDLAESVFDKAHDLFGHMVERRMGNGETEKYLERLFPRTKNQKEKGAEPLRWHRVRTILADTSVTPLDTRDTLWGLYNAVVRDEDFRATRESTPSARLRRIWFGNGSQLKLRALELARKLMETNLLN